ncbi:IS3 family transposase [Caenibacillus caldisaponilyticus]|uniref:IS3 family transposase n=4 Tax=Caenibacillus caldisaponilyticus TaxID=1674942 RepID=UPI00098830AE|nr:IS3 family transposase [Caenibacillus caldisaponilyticus]
MVGNLGKGGEALKFQVVDQLRHRHSVKDLCEYLGVSRSGYYRYLSRKNKPDQDEELAEKIRYIYQLRNKIYGYRRIQAELLRLYGLRVNHKKVLRIMQKLGIQAVIRRKRLCQNQSRTPMGVRIAENLLNRHFRADAPNQKWVTDVTWIRAGNQTLYLSVIMDLFNNEIVAYNMSTRNDNQLVLDTVRKAVEKRMDVTGTILHSDRGFQYTSYEYHHLLNQFGIRPSMSRKGNCLDNAAMESFFSHLKTEALYPYDIQHCNQAQNLIHNYIFFYNEERIQLKLNRLTPVEYRRQKTA